ncbi:DUF6597 domain-containing transcriptional factor [Archangium violaceum]|uniref:DUF6597 domain-containing transcriptional factor n=1 Tax=Archangium violaceum TaxID=83451 RepID=UPI003D2DA27E
MMHTLYRPRPPLDRLVESLWVSDNYVGQAPRQRVLPTGAQALVVLLGESPVRIYAGESTSESADHSGAILCGARSSPLLIGTSLGPIVGVKFRPGGALPFFDVPADALAEQTLSLEALWGSSSRSLRERLMAPPSRRGGGEGGAPGSGQEGGEEGEEAACGPGRGAEEDVRLRRIRLREVWRKAAGAGVHEGSRRGESDCEEPGTAHGRREAGPSAPVLHLSTGLQSVLCSW